MTHFGLSGSVALDVSRDVTVVQDPTTLDVVCDFLPDGKAEELEQQLQADFTREAEAVAAEAHCRHNPGVRRSNGCEPGNLTRTQRG
ncbi:MAG: NAD(P)/FAD-dependent oxidoreductase [Pirellulales bacterium]